MMSTKCPEILQNCEKYIVDKIIKGDLVGKAQLEASFEYLVKIEDRSNINEKEFDHACGIGIVVTEEEIKTLIDSLFDKFKEEIEEKKWNFDFSALLH